MERRGLIAALLLVASACAPGRSDFGYTTSNDPFYAALTTVRENLSDLSQYRGRPAEAARAFAQYEFVTAELQDKPDRVLLPEGVEPQVDSGHQQLRTTLGVAPDAPPRGVAAALNRFAAALDAGRRQEAMQELSQPFFTRGPQGTFDVLNRVPAMPAVQTAAANLALGPPGASDAVVRQRLHRRRVQQGAISNWIR
jgi:hypothetical protein